MKIIKNPDGSVSRIEVSLSETMRLSEDYAGICLACGEEAEGVEPDARKYKCAACGAHRVYGYEGLLFSDKFDIVRR